MSEQKLAHKEKISLSCDRPNFTEHDRYVLNRLRSHLIQTDEHNHVFSQNQQILTKFKQALDVGGAIILAIDGQVQFMTERAEQLLSQYFLPRAPQSLPESLQHWFEHQTAHLTFHENVSSPCLPLHMEQAGQRLVIRLIPDPSREYYLLLLEEQKTLSFSITAGKRSANSPQMAQNRWSNTKLPAVIE
jgi:hypothetical protein